MTMTAAIAPTETKASSGKIARYFVERPIEDLLHGPPSPRHGKAAAHRSDQWRDRQRIGGKDESLAPIDKKTLGFVIRQNFRTHGPTSCPRRSKGDGMRTVV